jgi:hypothetical protein
MLTERPRLVREISANFRRQREPRGQRDGSLRPYFPFSRPEPLFQTHYLSENLVAPGTEPGPLDLWTGTLTTRPERR